MEEVKNLEGEQSQKNDVTENETTVVENNEAITTDDTTEIEVQTNTAEENSNLEVVKSDLEKANKKIEELTSQLESINGKSTELDSTKDELKQAKLEVETANKTVKEYEGVLNKMAEEKLKALPEEFADLVPNNMTILEKLDWLSKAESKNLFKKDKGVSDIEIGKPMGATVDIKADTKDLSPSSMLSMAYNILKK